MKYCFDTSAFVEGWRRKFPRDVLKTLWEKDLPKLLLSGRVVCPLAVYEELAAGKDDLYKWVKDYKVIFVPETEDIQEKLILTVTKFPGCISKKGTKDAADPWVVATALATNSAVVTYESNKKHAFRIPNMCESLGIQCITLHDVIKQEGWKY